MEKKPSGGISPEMDPEIQLLKYKRKGTVILEILNSRSQKEDVEDFVSTIESIIPIINRMLTQINNIEKQDLHSILDKLRKSLEEYEQAVVKLDKTGRLKRFLTNNRLRKQLEHLNSELHKDIEFFVEIIIQVEVDSAEKEQDEDRKKEEQQLQQLIRGSQRDLQQGSAAETQNPLERRRMTLLSEVSPQDWQILFPPLPLPPPTDEEKLALLKEVPPKVVNLQSPYACFSPLLLENSDIFKDDWEMFFGLEAVMVEWNRFIEFLNSKISVSSEDEKMLKYILDNGNTGLMSRHKYKDFLRGFGPLQWIIQNIKEIFRAPWFYGYLSSKESEVLLCTQPAGTFLIRLSRSTPGSFALAFVYTEQRIVHILITSDQPNGFLIKDSEAKSETKFSDLSEIISFYNDVLQKPFVSDAPLQSWFQGDITSDEATEMLYGKPMGTFLIRFSSQIGFYAATYVDPEGIARHALIEHVNDSNVEGFRIHGEEHLFATMHELLLNYEGVLMYPLKTSECEVGLGMVKQIAEATYDPRLTTERRLSQKGERPVAQAEVPDDEAIIPEGKEEDVSTLAMDSSMELEALISTIESQNSTTTGEKPSPITELKEKRKSQRGTEEYQYLAKLALDPTDKKYPSKWLYLFTDSLSLSTHEFSLTTTWIQLLKQEFKQGKAFRIVSPEKRIIVSADKKEEKEAFLEKVQQQIVKLLEKDNNLYDSEGKKRF